MCIDKEQVMYSGCFDILGSGLFHIVIMTNLSYREIAILSDNGMGVGHGSGQEQGGENLRWSFIETICRHASLIPNQIIVDWNIGRIWNFSIRESCPVFLIQ